MGTSRPPPLCSAAPPGLLLRFRRSDAARGLGRRMEKGAKHLLVAAGRRLSGGGPPLGLDQVTDVRKAVIVRPNFRIGNTVISTPLIEAVHRRYAVDGGRLDYVAADTTASLLAQFPLDRVYTVSRRFLLNPLAALGLVRALRRAGYDAAIDGGRGSLTSALLVRLTGARYRIGRGRWVGSLLNVDAGDAGGGHVYEKEAALARAFSPVADPRPRCSVRRDERAAARGILGLEDGGTAMLALFVGGHRDKRWPAARWLELVQRLAAEGVPVALFSGPEETEFCARVEELGLERVRVIPIQPLRMLAACCAECTLAVSPDTGPMHLAAAVGTPVVAVLQVKKSLVYAPPGSEHRILMQPTVDEVVAALATHPAWPAARPSRESPCSTTLSLIPT